MGKSGCKICVGVTICFLVVAAIVLIAISLKTIEVHEVGVVYNTAAHKLGDTAKPGGLHTVPPGASIITYPNIFKVMSYAFSCINLDGVQIALTVTYQFRPQESKVPELIRLYEDFENYEDMLKLVGKSAILASCNEFDTYEVIAQRADFTANCKAKVAAAYAKVGSDVSGLQVDNIARPDEYNKALREKEAAREASVVKLNERKTLIVEAETELAKEKANAEIAIQQAESLARTDIIKAKSEAEAIMKQYEEEAGIYRQLKDQGFTGQSLFTYLQIETIDQAHNEVFIGLESPVNMTLT